jgi:hypothetical protein
MTRALIVGGGIAGQRGGQKAVGPVMLVVRDLVLRIVLSGRSGMNGAGARE